MQNSQGPGGADPDSPQINLSVSTVAEMYSSRADIGFQPSMTASRPNLIGNADNGAMLMAQSSLSIDLIQDIVNAATNVTPACEPALITAVLRRLVGNASECTPNK